jgi:hypothetical protein
LAGKKPTNPDSVVISRLHGKYPDVDFDIIVSNGIVSSVVGFKTECCGYQERNTRSILTTKHLCILCVKSAVGKGKTKSYDTLLEDLNKIHNGKYFYPESNRHNYVNRKSLTSVICSIHGEFTKKAQKHLSGQGCFNCRLEEMKQDGTLCGGYSEDFFNLNPTFKDIRAYFYYLKVGELFKVGITRINVNNRVRSIKSNSKLTVELVFMLTGSLYECYCYEQRLLKENSDVRIYPKWSTEVFSTDIFNGIYPNKLN